MHVLFTQNQLAFFSTICFFLNWFILIFSFARFKVVFGNTTGVSNFAVWGIGYLYMTLSILVGFVQWYTSQRLGLSFDVVKLKTDAIFIPTLLVYATTIAVHYFESRKKQKDSTRYLDVCKQTYVWNSLSMATIVFIYNAENFYVLAGF